ncbi:hypothetical protein AV274_5576 [Blastocystis sp. ATCC 50177/Nand II]|uniref:Uncharacterized protein n=1 Tax=Blastocystis sp. subtype 1 (strain ATCC 50177 / NandII) TaxID=478820 RepID=A0A196S6T1_BLAHN|nr:hypothetical protein AV274_5576 [Blastocystis sp. ATCC 50177/Nand II]
MKKEIPDSDMEDEDYLRQNFPACMTKKALVSAIKHYEGAFENRSRSGLVNQLETIILFQIRCENKSSGYTQLFYSPQEIVDSKFADDASEMKQEIERRGLPCPKWASAIRFIVERWRNVRSS